MFGQRIRRCGEHRAAPPALHPAAALFACTTVCLGLATLEPANARFAPHFPPSAQPVTAPVAAGGSAAAPAAVASAAGAQAAAARASGAQLPVASAAGAQVPAEAAAGIETSGEGAPPGGDPLVSASSVARARTRMDDLVQRAHMHAEAGSDSATFYLLAGVELDPGDPRSYRGILRYFENNGQLWQAYRIFHALIEEHGNQPWPRWGAGVVELTRGRAAEATDLFQDAIGAQPVAEILGDYLRARSQVISNEKLLEYVESLLRAAPRSAAMHYAKAVALSLSGDTDLATNHFRWALTLEPPHWVVERDFGRHLAAAGEHELARKHLLLARDLLNAELDPGSAEAIETEIEALEQQPESPKGD